VPKIPKRLKYVTGEFLHDTEIVVKSLLYYITATLQFSPCGLAWGQSSCIRLLIIPHSVVCPLTYLIRIDSSQPHHHSFPHPTHQSLLSIPSNNLLLPRLRPNTQLLPQHIRQARAVPQVHPVLILAALLLIHRRAEHHEVEPFRPAYGRGEPNLLVGGLFVEDVGTGGGSFDCEDAGLKRDVSRGGSGVRRKRTSRG